MSKNWPNVRLGEVLTHYTAYIEAPEPRGYRKLSVKLYGKGVVLDSPADGTMLKMKRHQLAKTGQVLLSEIWGKKGAIGFVPPEGDGALCTSHFFLFDIREDKLDQRWLKAIFDANYLQKQLDAEAKGTTGYAAVRPKIFLACEIPLPPVAEQRRVVARIEELAAQIHEARALRHEATEEAEALTPRETSSLLDDAGWSTSPLGEILAEKPRNGLGPQQVVESGGRTMLRINAVSSSATRFVDMAAAKQAEVADDVAEQFVIQHDDVFIVRYNGDIKRVAKPAIYKGRNESRVVYPDKVPQGRQTFSEWPGQQCGKPLVPPRRQVETTAGLNAPPLTILLCRYRSPPGTTRCRILPVGKKKAPARRSRPARCVRFTNFANAPMLKQLGPATSNEPVTSRRQIRNTPPHESGFLATAVTPQRGGSALC